MKPSIPLAALAAALCAGCACQPLNVDQRFGSAVLGAKSAQVADPAAAARRPGAGGADGKALAASVERYEKSFEVPPPPVNVLNIGVGSGGTSK